MYIIADMAIAMAMATWKLMGSSRVEKSLSRDKIKCEKPLWNDDITSDKANSTIQVGAKHITDNRHFRKK